MGKAMIRLIIPVIMLTVGTTFAIDMMLDCRSVPVTMLAVFFVLYPSFLVGFHIRKNHDRRNLEDYSRNS